MGYTHYWTLRKPIDAPTWRVLVNTYGALLDAAVARGIPFSLDEDEGPATAERVAEEKARMEKDPTLPIIFNGVFDDAHEDFFFSPSDTSFSFCKTGKKPYDILVVAFLSVLEDVVDDIKISSDGYPEDWNEGRALAQDILQRPLPSPAMFASQ